MGGECEVEMRHMNACSCHWNAFTLIVQAHVSLAERRGEPCRIAGIQVHESLRATKDFSNSPWRERQDPFEDRDGGRRRGRTGGERSTQATVAD